MANTRKTQNNNRKNDKKEKKVVKKTVDMKFYLNASNATNLKEYNRDTLLDILDKVPFGLISIPVYVHRQYMGGGNGYTNVGYIKSYDIDGEIFTVAVRNSYVKAIENLGDAVIFARVAVDNKGTVKTIIGLDIEPVNTTADSVEE